MLNLLKRLFAGPVGFDPKAAREARRAVRECSRYYAEGRHRQTGLSWYENQVIEIGLHQVIALVSREFIDNEKADIDALRKWARYEVGKQIRADHGYHPVGKAFNDYVRDMPVDILLNAEALKVLHDRTEPVRDFYTRFGPAGGQLLRDWQAGEIPDPRMLPASEIKQLSEQGRS